MAGERACRGSLAPLQVKGLECVVSTHVKGTSQVGERAQGPGYARSVSGGQSKVVPGPGLALQVAKGLPAPGHSCAERHQMSLPAQPPTTDGCGRSERSRGRTKSISPWQCPSSALY